MTIPLYRSAERTPGDRGYAFGVANKGAVANTVRAYRYLFQETFGISASDVHRIGVQVGDLLGRRWPDLQEEVGGIATGSGYDEVEVLALNARTEIVGAAMIPECSVVACVPPRTNRTVLLGQNWDWHPSAEKSRIVWEIMEPSGGTFTTLTEAGILAKIGMNSHGLGCCLNMLNSQLDGGEVGTPIHILLRLILQRCATAAEALDLLKSESMSASSCITIGSTARSRPAAVSIEVSPAGISEIRPDDRGVVVHTNHFLADPGSTIEATTAPDNTEERLRLLQRFAAQPGEEIEAGDVLDILSSHESEPNNLCRHGMPNTDFSSECATLASVVMDLGARHMIVVDGTPCSACSEAASVVSHVRVAEATAPEQTAQFLAVE